MSSSPRTVQVGPLSVPLAEGARIRERRSPSEVVAILDLDTAAVTRREYHEWATQAGWRLVTSTDHENGWSLVVDNGRDTMIFSCGYMPDQAQLLLQFESGDDDSDRE